MYDINQFFYYKLLFTVELLVAEWLFTFRLRKRPQFALRYLGGVIACFGVVLAIPVFYNTFYMIFIFAVLFAATIVMHVICYDEPPVNILFCLTAGYIMQHIAYCLNNCMLLLTGLNSNVFGIYSNELANQNIAPANLVFGYIFTFVVYYITYYVFFLLFANRIKRNADLRLKNLSLFIVTGTALFVSIVVNSVIVYVVTDVSVILITSIYNVVCCGFIMNMQFSMLNTSHLEKELHTVYRLLHESHERFQSAKENIDLINMKCHDMKHQIRQIGRTSAINEAALSEIENIISIYDSEVKTGNEALDTILTEKSLFCKKNNIRLTCLADGEQLNFMNEADLYALFGNAVDNAMSAVMNIADEQKRFIGLTVRRVKDFISVNINNYFEGDLRFDQAGLPVTTKDDTNFHGYGLKSIQFITEKHNGRLSISHEDNIFNLNIIFPVVI